MVAEIQQEIKAATEYGDKAPSPQPDDLYRYVYAEEEGE
jgi:TPP-dependent pyruvate/acetoin dehydrogenase alpha subunit